MTGHAVRWARNPGAWLMAAVTIAILVLMARFWPIGFDYYIFRSVAEAWLRGETRLFDAQSPLFYSPPWLLFWFAPLTILSFPLGQAVHNLASLIGILLTAYTFRSETNSRLATVILAVANLYTVNLIVTGNLEGLVLAGVGMGWAGIRHRNPWLLSAGLWFMSVKPVNVLAVGLLYLVAIRRWPITDWIKALSWPGLSVLISLFISGVDWPIRYFNLLKVDSLTNYFLVSTIWRAADVLGIPVVLIAIFSLVAVAAAAFAVWRLGLTAVTLSLVLGTTLTVTPYATGVHYVLLVPVFLIIGQRRGLAIAAYLATWTPLLRLVWGYEIVWIDVIYPLILLAGVWLICFRETPKLFGAVTRGERSFFGR